MIKGDYVKKWLPELKDLPKKFIHKPWELNDKNFKLGKDYPYPIVKHEEARVKALNHLKNLNLNFSVTKFKFFFQGHMDIFHFCQLFF